MQQAGKIQVSILQNPHVRDIPAVPFVITSYTFFSCSLHCSKTHTIKCTRVQNNSDLQKLEACGSTLAAKPLPAGKVVPDVVRLEDLFLQYPNLKSSLRDIYVATLEPNIEGGRDGGNDWTHRRQEQTWTPDKGFETGLLRLRSQMAAGSDVKGLEALAKLINPTVSNVSRNVPH